jgi:RecQ family ATP-dependent DNA helicase
MTKQPEVFTSLLSKILAEQSQKIDKPIFVLSGVTDYVDASAFEEHLADPTTFDKDGNTDLFTQAWFGKIFPLLISRTDYLILSHQQYAYVIEYLNPDFFQKDLVVIYDNLRSLYPIKSADDYIEAQNEDGFDARPENLPTYQAEQVKIGDDYFYALKKIESAGTMIPFFQEQKALEEYSEAYSENEVIDIATDTFALDSLLNRCVKTGNYDSKLVVKLFRKQPLSEQVNADLQRANYILSLFGGAIYRRVEQSIQKDYVASDDALRLLRRYWGENASFRNINVYENPDESTRTTPISQGLIVDTIINEYKIGKQYKTFLNLQDGKTHQEGNEIQSPRDIFITAPTGAGKSLLFQLPAFYAAENGDVTIVVSPLKALMNDQVVNLRAERKYQAVSFLNSDLNFMEREHIIQRCKDGEINILYLSPELLLSYDIRYFIGERNLGLLIIDEAHLITTWGRDFRVDYWFLGYQISKFKKYNKYSFPLVALTATAVYGGTNDMVFDSISSLYMHDPHKFLGEVRRDNIEFVINTRDDYKEGRFEVNKRKETIQFIKGISKLGCKTIVYAPFKKHVEKLAEDAAAVDPNLAVAFHGGYDSDIQSASYSRFRNNQTMVMICTKAFGMGIDIPDIECVYHHAPSGLLPDYVQEIGRAARLKNIHGFAALTFSPADLRYSKQLFGISSLRESQLRAILQKISKLYYDNGNERNMLISASDFSYIFSTNDDVDQKVMTALMMIEKDYLNKCRFNVLIARPKALFTEVYARTNEAGLRCLNTLYGDCFTQLPWEYRGYYYLQIDLEKIWTHHRSDMSFPQLKKKFYDQKLLNDSGVDLTPLLKMTYFREQNANDVLMNTLSAIERVLSDLQLRGSFFSVENFQQRLQEQLGEECPIKELTDFILSSYTEALMGLLENDAFLQKRDEVYRVFNGNFRAKISQLRNLYNRLFSEETESSVTHYVNTKDSVLRNYMRLGAIFEILSIGTYTSQGGESPKIFIRINDPKRINNDAYNKGYTNSILESVRIRHHTSCQIFEHFFMRYFSNQQRWDFIEDFFLGMPTEDLLTKYEGGTRNYVDIVKYIAQNRHNDVQHDVSQDRQAYMQEFEPNENGFYSAKSMLTLEDKTQKIRDWIADNPVLLHRTILQYKLKLENASYQSLIAILEQDHKQYFRDFKGLKLFITFKGYEGKVQAYVPYKDEPVKFYKWWKTHQTEVTLTKKEKLELFFKVDELDPNTLIKEHKQEISK